MHLTTPTLLTTLLLLPTLALATDCTSSSSTPWPFSSVPGESDSDSDPVGSNGSGVDGSITDTCAPYQDDVDAYQACAENALRGQCLALGNCDDDGDTSDLISDGDLISGSGDDLISGSGSGDIASDLIGKRQSSTLSCADAEMCYQYTDGSLLCYDLATGDYHDDNGGTGNLLDSSYNGPDDDGDDSSSSSSSNDGNDPSSGQMLKAPALMGGLGLAAAFLL